MCANRLCFCIVQTHQRQRHHVILSRAYLAFQVNSLLTEQMEKNEINVKRPLMTIFTLLCIYHQQPHQTNIVYTYVRPMNGNNSTQMPASKHVELSLIHKLKTWLLHDDIIPTSWNAEQHNKFTLRVWHRWRPSFTLHLFGHNNGDSHCEPRIATKCHNQFCVNE